MKRLLLILAFCLLASPAYAQAKGGLTPFGKWFLIGLAVFIILFKIAIAKHIQKTTESEKQKNRELALKHGLEFSKEITPSIDNALENTSYSKDKYKKKHIHRRICDIFTKSDHDATIYLFYNIIARGKSWSHYAVCLCKMNYDLGVHVSLRGRRPGFFEKISTENADKTLREVNITGHDAFSKMFVVFADQEDAAAKLITPEVMEYCMAHSKRLLEGRIEIERSGIQFSLYLGDRLKKELTPEELPEVIELTKGMKDRLVKE
ncbi:hypothetical protein ACFL1E_05975 [Candidatus Omnitrophota bacterium]